MITVLGSINMDLFAFVDTPPRPGETVQTRKFTTAPGGKGANQALAAARAGGAVRMIGAIGDDGYGEPCIALLREAGVDLSLVQETPGPSGMAFILIDAKGENQIVLVPGANETVSPDPDMVHPGIFLAQLETPISGIEIALEAARATGAVTLFNPAPFDPVCLPVLDLVDILIVNEVELSGLCQALDIEEGTPENTCQDIATRQNCNVLATFGPTGAILSMPDQPSRSFEAPEVDVVATVGAGDTLCGYLAAALDQGQRLEDAIPVAIQAASLACTKAGAQPSIPTKEDLRAASQF